MINNNDFKYIIKRVIIGLIIAFILFNINKCNASALVYKGQFWTNNTQSIGDSLSGTLSENDKRVILWSFNNFIFNNSYDYIGFKFGNFEFEKGYQSGNYCMEWSLDSSSSCSSNSCYFCNKYFNYDGIESTYEANLYITASLRYGSSSPYEYTPCYWSDNEKDMLLCPIDKKYSSSPVLQFEINNYNTYLHYNVSLNGTKYYFNNESTEIVSGLTSVQQQQQNTTQAIEDLTTNINDNNISGANSSTNSALSGIDNSVSNTLDNSISANQLNTILSNFTNQLSNTTCSPITFPIPYTNENIVLPCLGTEFSQRIPIIWDLYELIITGVIVLRFWQHSVEFVLNVLDPYHIGANNVQTGGGK